MLSLVNVTKSFVGYSAPILSDFSLEIMQGEFCVVLGNNGSGKSTLLRCISGEYAINSGIISIDNQEVVRQDRSKFIASVTQDINAGTVAEMTLLENIVLSQMRCRAARFKFYNNKLQRAAIIAGIKELNLGLEVYIDKPIGILSGGQRQTIATLMAVTSNPQILLLDEHTSALDPNTQNLLMEYTANNIAQHKITTMMITHKIEIAMRYGNRLIVIDKGKIVLDVKSEEKKSLNTAQILGFFGRQSHEL